jgi:hypothetical protein
MRFVVLVLLIGLFTLATRSGDAQPGETDPSARAQELFETGRRAIMNNKFAQAYEPLRQAWELRQTYDVAGLLGQTEYQLEKYRDAAEHLAFSIRHYPPKESAAPKKRLEGWLADSKKHVGTVTVDVNKPGAEVLIDGKSVGRSPLPDAVYVEPGEHVFEARLDGHTAATKNVAATTGGDHAIKLELVEKLDTVVLPPSGLDNPRTNGGTSPGPGRERNWVPTLVAGGIAVVGIGTGVGFLIAAGGKNSDRDDTLAGIPGDADSKCFGGGGAYASDCERASELKDDRNRFRVFGYVGLGVGAAAGVAAVLLWPRSAERSALRVSPVVSEAEQGVRVVGQF